MGGVGGQGLLHVVTEADMFVTEIGDRDVCPWEGSGASLVPKARPCFPLSVHRGVQLIMLSQCLDSDLVIYLFPLFLTLQEFQRWKLHPAVGRGEGACMRA